MRDILRTPRDRDGFCSVDPGGALTKCKGSWFNLQPIALSGTNILQAGTRKQDFPPKGWLQIFASLESSDWVVKRSIKTVWLPPTPCFPLPRELRIKIEDPARELGSQWLDLLALPPSFLCSCGNERKSGLKSMWLGAVLDCAPL